VFGRLGITGAEHLTPEQIERMLTLLAARLAPGFRALRRNTQSALGLCARRISHRSDARAPPAAEAGHAVLGRGLRPLSGHARSFRRGFRGINLSGPIRAIT